MPYPSPRELLEKYGLHPKKSWGQNFLGDQAILDSIAALAVLAPGERVVEIGAGLGHLTSRLLLRGAEVVSVERDRDMARVLRGELGDRITLVEADAVRLDYRSLASGNVPTPTSATATQSPRIAVVGNLPYHLTSPILFSLLDQSDALLRAVFLLQREVGVRLAATPGSKDWGLLSVLLQQKAEVTVERVVPPGAFHPPPKVASAVVRMTFGPPRAEVRDEPLFRRLVKAGFGQRRKTLANALRAGRIAPEEDLERALRTAEIDPRRRGETLTVAEWARLEKALGA
jgi:16S rRNA (adenine1518-N6/adenine1519-N6)-dimethyltransferase